MQLQAIISIIEFVLYTLLVVLSSRWVSLKYHFYRILLVIFWFPPLVMTICWLMLPTILLKRLWCTHYLCHMVFILFLSMLKLWCVWYLIFCHCFFIVELYFLFHHLFTHVREKLFHIIAIIISNFFQHSDIQSLSWFGLCI